MPLLLNCDLGEIEDPEYRIEKTVMPLIDMANIACGFHAGNSSTMTNTLKIAAQHGVVIGAHPGYNDPDNFGRTSIAHSAADLITLLHRQIATLDKLARDHSLDVAYVKPHGALYNDMMAESAVFDAIIAGIARYEKPLKLMMLATANADKQRLSASKQGVELIFETFADRCYSDQGFLVPRSQPGAIHSHEAMLAQVQQLCEQGSVTSIGGKLIPIDAQTLCIHGDSPDSVAALAEIVRIVRKGEKSP